jgi:hypothetical protein
MFEKASAIIAGSELVTELDQTKMSRLTPQQAAMT